MKKVIFALVVGLLFIPSITLGGTTETVESTLTIENIIEETTGTVIEAVQVEEKIIEDDMPVIEETTYTYIPEVGDDLKELKANIKELYLLHEHQMDEIEELREK